MDDGTNYKLYRADTLAAGDTFFAPFDGQRIGVVGKEEKETGYFLVEALRLKDGTEIRVPEIGSQIEGSSIFSDGGTQNGMSAVVGTAAEAAGGSGLFLVGRGRRLPRKLKKRLKRKTFSEKTNSDK